MLVTILGCGTSVGVPMIGKTSHKMYRNPKNHRLRSSCLVEPFGRGKTSILIDTSPDLPQQVLRFFPKKPRLDAVLLTHSHADHLHGLDDIRPFNFLQGYPIPLYAASSVIRDVRTRFPYMFSKQTYIGGGLPRVTLKAFKQKGVFQIQSEHNPQLAELDITPIKVEHGPGTCFGFRIGRFAYITDTSRIPTKSLKLLKNLDLLVLDCLRFKPHSTHLHVEASIEYVRLLKPRRTVFTHMNQDIEYESFRKSLPQGMKPAYDGLQIKVNS